jgi:hypothetical protein
MIGVSEDEGLRPSFSPLDKDSSVSIVALIGKDYAQAPFVAQVPSWTV